MIQFVNVTKINKKFKEKERERKMRKFKKWMTVVALVLAAIMVFVACGGNGGTTTAPDADTDVAADDTTDDAPPADEAGDGEEPVTLRVTWWGNTTRDLLYQEINELFMAENPHVTIVTESPGWGDYWTAIATAYASGTAPDVVQFQSAQIGEFAAMGVMHPLQEFIDAGILNVDDFEPGLLSTGVFNDELYMITLGVTAVALYVNQTYLDELGIELWPEDADITWDEFEAFMADVQAELPDGAFALQDYSHNNDVIWAYVRQVTPEGVEWVNADGEFAPSLEAMSEWFDKIYRMRSEGIIPDVALAHEHTQMAWEEGPFPNRQTLFLFANANQIGTHQAGTEDEIVFRRIPTNPDFYNLHGDFLITSSFAISETSENKELAAKYIDFFVNTLAAQQIFDFELGIPGSLVIQDALLANASATDIMQTEYVNSVASIFMPFMVKAPGVWAVQDEIAGASQQVGAGAMTPEQAAQMIIDTANDLIRANQ